MLWPFEFFESFRCSIPSFYMSYVCESDILWKVMTIWISRELSLFNSVRLDILCTWIEPPSEKLWTFEFLESFLCWILCVSYIMRLNRTSEWKVMTIWISRELSLFNFMRLDILCDRNRPLGEKLWPFKFLESIRSSISSVSVYYAPDSELWVKSFDHLNFSRASIV